MARVETNCIASGSDRHLSNTVETYITPPCVQYIIVVVLADILFIKYLNDFIKHYVFFNMEARSNRAKILCSSKKLQTQIHQPVI